MASPIPTIVVALIQRGSRLLLVEAQGPDDPTPFWMLPGGQVEADEPLLDALGRELAEETGLQIVGEPRLVFEVEVDYRTDIATGVYRALTYACEAAGELRPADPDGLVRSAAWVESGDALDRLSMLEWYECEPLRRFLSDEAVAGTSYRYRVTGKRGSMMLEGLEDYGRDLLTAPEIVDLARTVAMDLVAEGSQAVVLAGSHVRGDATDLSDIDLYAIGSGPAYTLRVVRGRLVAISWRSEDDERRALRQPASVGAVVPAWRAAHVVHDPDGVAEGLKREAEAFDWAAISAACDEWVTETTTGYAEEVLKLVMARRADDRLLAAVQRSVLALRLPKVMAVQHRLLYETENRLWHLVAQAMGDEWATAQTAALGLDPGEDADRAALQLFTLAVDEVRPLLTPAQAAVVDLALRATNDESDGPELV